MPRAVIIEFNGTSPVQITTGIAHGNTVRDTFLAFAPSGWDADVIACPYDFGVAAYDWIADRTATYSLVICSNIMDVSYTRNIEKVQRVLGMPLFLSMNNSGSPNLYEQGVNAIYTGAGTSSNISEQGYQLMTFTEATNLSAPSNLLTSFTNAVTAGRAAALLDAGLTAAQIWMAIRQQSTGYPTWTTANGYGAAPFAYTVPTSYDPAPVLASEMWRTNNTLSVVFLPLTGTSPTHLNIYRNGVLDASYPAAQWIATSASNYIGSTAQYRVNHPVVSDGGSFEFTLTLTYAEGESESNYGYDWTVSGFTDNDNSGPQPEYQYVELYAKSRKAMSVPVRFADDVNVQTYAAVRWRAFSASFTEVLNVTASVVNANAAYINANASVMNVDAGLYRQVFEGQSSRGWLPFAAGRFRLEKGI